MKKSALLLTFTVALAPALSYSYSERDERIEELAGQTGFRKSLKILRPYLGFAAIPGVLLGALLCQNGQTKAGIGTALVMPAVYLINDLIRKCHKPYVKLLFRKLYNKRVDMYGNLISAFSSNATHLPYALDNQQFITFGFAAGYTVDELVHLANKCGRTDVAMQLNHGEYFAHNL